jgi:chromosome segregation protein
MAPAPREAAEQVGGAPDEAEALRGPGGAVRGCRRRRPGRRLRRGGGERPDRRAAARRPGGAGELRRSSAAGPEAESGSSRHALEDARDEAAAAANVIEGHNLRMEERTKKAAAAAEKKLQLTVDAGALDNRIRMLTGDGEGLRGLFQGCRPGDAGPGDSLRGIRGPVASLMKTDAKYTVAIEIALGAGLQNIVVDREEDAKGAIGFLKRRDAGRATFLPMNGHPGGRAAGAAAGKGIRLRGPCLPSGLL